MEKWQQIELDIITKINRALPALKGSEEIIQYLQAHADSFLLRGPWCSPPASHALCQHSHSPWLRRIWATVTYQHGPPVRAATSRWGSANRPHCQGAPSLSCRWQGSSVLWVLGQATCLNHLWHFCNSRGPAIPPRSSTSEFLWKGLKYQNAQKTKKQKKPRWFQRAAKVDN